MGYYHLAIVALTLSSLLCGMHLFGAFALNPMLRKLDADEYVRQKQSADIEAPRLAKPLMIATLIAAIASTAAAHIDGEVVSLVATGIGTASLIVVFVAIVRGDLPINQQMALWQPDNPPADWGVLRDRWERFFLLRVGANVIAVLSFMFAVGGSALLAG